MPEHQILAEVNRPNVSWGAIIAGAMIAIAVQILLMSLGAGFKLVIDPTNVMSLDQASLLKIGGFTVAANLVAIFIGGYVAGRFGGFPLRSVSALHGLCSWALVAVFSMIVIESGMSGLSRMTHEAMMGVAASVGAWPNLADAIDLTQLPEGSDMGGLFDTAELHSRMGWVTFISLGLGAISSILGGLLGGRRKLFLARQRWRYVTPPLDRVA